MEVIVRRQGGLRFEASARGHVVVTDQPKDLGGLDQAMTPPELLLAALGGCAGYYAAEYLRARSLPADGLEIRVSAEKALQPARLAEFRIEVCTPAADSDRNREGLMRAVQKCLIHNTLLQPPDFEIVVPAIAAAGQSAA
jgi:uncharacterized OsmC-like protein